MDITVTEVEKNEFYAECRGKIKTYENFLDFKEKIQPILKRHEQEPIKILLIFFINSYPINSYTLGYLLKLKENNLMNIKIHTNEPKLFNFFKMLELHEKFGVIIKQII